MELPKELAPSSTFSYGSLLPFQSKSCAGPSAPIRNLPSFSRGDDPSKSSKAACWPVFRSFQELSDTGPSKRLQRPSANSYQPRPSLRKDPFRLLALIDTNRDTSSGLVQWLEGGSCESIPTASTTVIPPIQVPKGTSRKEDFGP